MRATSTADANTNVISSKIFTSELATMLVESSREHHVTMVGILVRV